MASQAYRQSVEDRSEARDEVLHRTRLTLFDHRSLPITVVNLSPHGFMARTDTDVSIGEWVKVTLPVVGTAGAVVRWSLGGRIGCQLERPIDARTYRALLTAAGG